MPRPARDDRFRQPESVEEVLSNYLDMTKPRHKNERRQREQPRMEEQPQREPPRRTRTRPIDNEGLSLEEGNDFA